RKTLSRVAGNLMHGWQANKKRTCARPVLLGLCPKMKNHPLRGWIFILPVRFYVEKFINL
ncbi:MAG: hypothetical protein IKL18_07735, partial [Oscillospiraceae bacterium]|nr:hypothetical protein [Oscillospiraceae bacterium]MBR6658040.1 hypothetical protein [Oscillospiraceae bacterium]